VESSGCITIMEYADDGKSLHVSVTIPCLEVGTIGGGTGLAAQAACLDIIGVRGSGDVPGDNSREFAQIICAAVLAGELSLIAALAANHLVAAHMENNRKPLHGPVVVTNSRSEQSLALQQSGSGSVAIMSPQQQISYGHAPLKVTAAEIRPFANSAHATIASSGSLLVDPLALSITESASCRCGVGNGLELEVNSNSGNNNVPSLRNISEHFSNVSESIIPALGSTCSLN
jgi:hypothetical protein